MNLYCNSTDLDLFNIVGHHKVILNVTNGEQATIVNRRCYHRISINIFCLPICKTLPKPRCFIPFLHNLLLGMDIILSALQNWMTWIKWSTFSSNAVELIVTKTGLHLYHFRVVVQRLWVVTLHWQNYSAVRKTWACSCC